MVASAAIVLARSLSPSAASSSGSHLRLRRRQLGVEGVQVVLELELVEKRAGRRTPVLDQQLLLLAREVELGGGHVARIDRDRAHAGRVRDEARVPGLLR